MYTSNYNEKMRQCRGRYASKSYEAVPRKVCIQIQIVPVAR